VALALAAKGLVPRIGLGCSRLKALLRRMGVVGAALAAKGCDTAIGAVVRSGWLTLFLVHGNWVLRCLVDLGSKVIA